MLCTRTVSWNRQKDSKCEQFPTLHYIAKRVTEGERSLIKHFVRSLSMPHELLMSMANFTFLHGQVGNCVRFLHTQICVEILVEHYVSTRITLCLIKFWDLLPRWASKLEFKFLLSPTSWENLYKVNIMTSHVWWSLPLFLWPVCLIK